MIYCPKGLHDSARGFNLPGIGPKPHRALKGRHIDWPSSVKKTMSSPPVSACTSTGDWSRFGGARSGAMEPRSPAPLQGASPGWKVPGVETPG